MSFLEKDSGVKIFNVTGDYLANYFQYSVGDTVTVPHSTYGDIIFDVVAKDHDGQGIITLVSKYIITTRGWFTSRSHSNYSASEIRTWLNDTFYNGIDPSFRSKIKAVNKITGKWNSSAETETTTEYCWLLSETEVGLSQYRSNEGSAYSVFNNTTRVKTYNGTAMRWWLRSPSINAGEYAEYVQASGSIGMGTTETIHGVVVGLCI